ncbi:hypothetical protein [Leeuwenhoekiella marinoflava]|jgi:hypothetical protein|uniref:Uncharacterized protein n=2 Tax=Leeuwenhoekiella marinoflava TaxID=988 RepID=A0A4Q0PLG5_9FLAO|nr:hypothetical protein [Leeuwenhoekiella marinoflava]RXG29253.1 hypothetical protein DSL99_2192 [Leeuwenhoekiella marinoflava]SHF36380.1 hypothetical protein SAMN02745246_02329 [Leeuwenhoekiella marinoflava DSM 3653]|tara:strand:- start:749 stop:1387 length:639 start_codon:yes stop_codon:yes gene_type:complete
MKTKTIIPIVVFLLCFQQVIQAQTLKKKIQKSVVEIGNTFAEIPMERLKRLDQVAFLIFKKLDDNTKVNVLFVDSGNQEISQLALVWLQTGMIYYGHNTMLSLQSAGISPKIEPISKLAILKEYGFSIRNTRGENPMSYNIDYGSGNWVVYPKSLQSLQSTSDNTIEIYVEKISSNENENNNVELIFTDTNTIAREMLYLATRINNLLQTKQ